MFADRATIIIKSGKGGYLFKDFWGDAVSRLYHFMKK